jgi:cyclomaltodextrinase / maltogenic alpha-amylase / neopullulanase
MPKPPRSVRWAFLISLVLLVGPLATIAAQQSSRDVAHETARRSPDWLRNGVIYEINPRTFSAAGNFDGITDRLDDLRNLGVTILWLMPIHPIGQLKKKGTLGSPYAVRDYKAINPDYGSKDDLHRLVTEAHRRGLKVIIDIVANHTAWDSVMMQTPDFYRRDSSGQIVSPYDWTDVAALDYSKPRLRAYMIDMLEYWLRDFDLDGFRCDAAGEVPTTFWEEARKELEKVKPDMMMLAEADKPDLLVHAFDLDYAWPFYSSLANVFAAGASSATLDATWEEQRARFPHGAIHMRFADNHDEQRAIARFGMGGALAASALVFTMDGVPLIYNGTEAGDSTESGAPVLFEKLPVFWPIAERRPEFPRFYRQIIALRRAHPALCQGETEWLHNSDEGRVVTYLRKAAHEEFLVAVNTSNRPFAGTVEVANGPAFHEVTPGIGNSSDQPAPPRPEALPAIALGSWGYRIFQREVP